MARIPTTVRSVSRAWTGSGVPVTILVCSLPPELLEQLTKGQPIELVVSSVLPAAAAIDPASIGRADDLSEPPTTTLSSPSLPPSPPVPVVAPVSAAEPSEGDLSSVPAAQLPTSAPTATPATISAGVATGPDWMRIEPQPDWSATAAESYKDGLKRAGYDYAALADLVELLSVHHLRPRHLGAEGRRESYRWVNTTREGRAAYTAAHAARRVLLESARRLRIQERKAAAAAAGTGTEPAALSAAELWRLLEQAGPQSTAARPPKPPTPEPDPGVCKSCGAAIVWIKGGGEVVYPCDPTVHVASAQGTGTDVELIGNDGTRRKGKLASDGPIVGRISHFATCPDRDQHRKRKSAKETA
jgi:hypothetical protein